MLWHVFIQLGWHLPAWHRMLLNTDSDLILKVVLLGFAGGFDTRVLEGSFTPLSWKACIFLICLWHPEVAKGYVSIEKQQIKSVAVLSFIFPSTVSPLFFDTSFCAIILSSDLFLFQKLSSQFFFVHDPPLFAHPFYTPALHSMFHTLCVAHLRGLATCDSTTECPPCFMAWHRWYHFTLSMINILNFFLTVLCAFSSFLAPWRFVLSLVIPCKLHLTLLGAFISRLVKPLAI